MAYLLVCLWLKGDNSKSLQNHEDAQTHTFIRDGCRVMGVQQMLEILCNSSKMLKNKNLHTYNFLISFLNVYLRDMVIRIYSHTNTQKLNVNVHSNFSHNSQKEEIIPVATNKPNVVFSYCRLLLDDKKGWHASTWVPTDSTVLSEGAHHKGYIFYFLFCGTHTRFPGPWSAWGRLGNEEMMDTQRDKI